MSELTASTAKNDIIRTTVYNDSCFMLSICLARFANRSSWCVLATIFKTSKTNVSVITKSIVHRIYLNFSRLLNIYNCCYINKYLKLLADKSISQCSAGVREYTTHMIDGTHINISNPTKKGGSSYDPTYDESKHSDTI